MAVANMRMDEVSIEPRGGGRTTANIAMNAIRALRTPIVATYRDRGTDFSFSNSFTQTNSLTKRRFYTGRIKGLCKNRKLKRKNYQEHGRFNSMRVGNGRESCEVDSTAEI
jgi:hypothetical protein